LVAIEQSCFETDRLSRRSFQHFLTRGHAELFVAERDGRAYGYGLVLFHRGTALARLYSLAVVPEAQGQGIARLLLRHADEIARHHDAVALRLEVRADNARAIALYRQYGFKPFKTLHHYYEDDADGVQMQKPIRYQPAPDFPDVPYLHQTTDFTCGPASLMMAIAAQELSHRSTRKAANPLDPVRIDPDEELRIWREATTIFMTSGHGGCGPHGLALAAYKRGHAVRIVVSEPGPLFLDTVRDAKKKAVMERVQTAFEHDLEKAGLEVEIGTVTPDSLERALRSGWIPLILISTYLFNREKTPHWVVVTGVDDKVVLVHDPDMDEDLSKSDVDCVHVPIRRSDFERVARFGRSKLQAAVLIGPRRELQ
jgi:ribosomal protein S18 acetylase RimI-like enzyme